MRRTLARIAMVRWMQRQSRGNLLFHRLTWWLLYPTAAQRTAINTRWSTATHDMKAGRITLDALVDQFVETYS
jgi:hypothetical protein